MRISILALNLYYTFKCSIINEKCETPDPKQILLTTIFSLGNKNNKEEWAILMTQIVSVLYGIFMELVQLDALYLYKGYPTYL